MHMKPITSAHDVMPSHIIKDMFDIIGPSIQVITNSCLASGTVPACFKHKIVQTPHKTHNLDVKCWNNYQPFSNLPFVSKIMEKTVLSILQPFLNTNEILDPFQSGFKALHRTETALLKVKNELLLKKTPKNCYLLSSVLTKKKSVLWLNIVTISEEPFPKLKPILSFHDI